MSAMNSSESLNQLQLLRRPQKQVNESEIGHVFRTATANGLSGRFLSDWVSVPMRHGLTKFCPTCLAESPVFKAEWSHPDALWCDSHRQWLVDTCTRCLKPLRWQRDSLLQCSCGKVLSTIGITPLAELSMESLHWVIGRVKRQPGLPRSGMKQRLALGLLVGAYVVTNGQDLPLHKRHGSAVASKRALLVAGLPVLTSWPHRFDHFLDDLYWRSTCAIPHSRESNLFRAFGQQLLKLYADHPHDPVRIRFQLKQDLHARRALNGRHRLATERVREQNRWLTVSAAAQELEVAPAVLSRLTDIGKLNALERQSERGRTLTVVEQASVVRLKAELQGLFDGTTAAKRLGLNKAQFRSVVHAGFLQPVLPATKAGMASYFSGTALGEFLSRWEARVLPGLPVDALSFNRATKHALLLERGLTAMLVGAVMAGELAIYFHSTSQPGIQRFCFSKAEVRDWARIHRSQQWVYPTGLAARLHIKSEVAQHLIANKALSCPRTPLSHSEADRAIAAFRQEYVLASSLAKRNQQSPRWLAARLAKKGITPVHGPAVDGCRMNIYRRLDIPESLLRGATS